MQKDYAQKDSLIKRINLPNLLYTKDGIYWRFYAPYKNGASIIIDIHADNRTKTTGFVTFYTFEDTRVSNEKPTNRVYAAGNRMNKKVADKLYKMIQSLELNRLSSNIQDTVKNADGSSVILMYLYNDSGPHDVEYADNDHYTFKEFRNPKNDSLITKIVDSVKSGPDFEHWYKKFDQHIPFESYTSVWMIFSKKLNDKQKQVYKKERDKYRKSHGLD